ncbi:hypothetical protein M422DRAFT_57202 [Sphaerobolus stellatus SS14]|uniref:Uncharacterized protein n=1 Tax=Sphaerobolus stellatus (strain SS14) TaxID=990650 RepID=A0A0C9U079_SPHS4|nr:hypothetical protein M422DRAFT_57202 [Sphaerobolus stellatus SS14]
MLGNEGTSDDESDEEATPGSPFRQRKRVRVVQLAWRSQWLVDILRYIDNHYRHEACPLQGKRGNAAHERVHARPRVDYTRVPKNLPCNFYDDNWYYSLNDYERYELNAAPEWYPSD